LNFNKRKEKKILGLKFNGKKEENGNWWKND